MWRSEVIASGVTMTAIALFTLTGSVAVPTAVRQLLGGGQKLESMLIAAFLLNIALILFAWRRCREVRDQSDARAAAEQASSELVYHDYTTELLNRRGLARIYDEVCSKDPGSASLLILDLDRFKMVNDMYGHAAGDQVLCYAASVLRKAAPARAHAARLGGDEFALLLLDQQADYDIERIGSSILERLASPMSFQGGRVHIGASIGIAVGLPTDVLEDLLRRSDLAMYEAKRRGRNQLAWFDGSMEDLLLERSRLESGIRQGLERGEFVPYFQPQVDLATKRLHGLEVLARWEHPELGLVDPSRFIAIAEESGLIGDLSLSVMRQALIQARAWPAELMVAINISPIQLQDPALPQKILGVLTETGFPAARLELEITESSLFDNLELALASVESLKNQKITISLDDFGTGYSSLTQLQALPFDRIKIDRSFVMTMTSNPESAAIVDAIARLAASLKLPVTAEGVESEEIGALLKSIGCGQGQGWLYGKPLPGAEINSILRSEADSAKVASSSGQIEIGDHVGERRRNGRRRRVA